MSVSVPITITNAGLAKLINANNSGTAAIAIVAIGVTASIVAADPTLTVLPAEIKRISTISGQVVAANVIHIGMEDSSADPYTMNSFGLYLADGTLFAVYGQATPIYIKTAASIGMLACDITLSQGSASSITFGATGFLNPPASMTVPGVVQLATQAQANAGTDTADVLTPATAKAAAAGWLPAGSSDIAGLVKLATQAQANAGTDAADALTPATAAAAVLDWIAAGTFIMGTDGTMSGTTANGYWEKRANGILEQWGTVALPSGNNVDTGTLALPLPFIDTNYVITGNVHLAANIPGNWHPAVFIVAPSTTGTASWVADTVNNSYPFSSGNSFSWRAIGHYK